MRFSISFLVILYGAIKVWLIFFSEKFIFAYLFLKAQITCKLMKQKEDNSDMIFERIPKTILRSLEKFFVKNENFLIFFKSKPISRNRMRQKLAS
jgi:hypothetical protein